MGLYLGQSSQVLTINDTSAKFTSAMTPGIYYRFTATIDCWIKITATGGTAAAATANNHLYQIGQTLILKNDATDGTTNAFVHAVRAGSTNGTGNLSPLGAG